MSIAIGIRLDDSYLDDGPTGPTLRRFRGEINNASDVSGALTTGLILTAGANDDGYVGYSSFADDSFGDLTFPNKVLPAEDKPLLGLMSLPGGGDYIVFDKDARADVSGQKLSVGSSEAILDEADVLSYNTTSLRTQIIFLDEKFSLGVGEEYTVKVSSHTESAIDLAGAISQESDYSASLSLSHNLSAEIDQPNSLSGLLDASIDLEGHIDQGSSVDGSLRVEQNLAGAVEQNSDVAADLEVNSFRRLIGDITQISSFSGDIDSSDPDASALIAAMTVAPSSEREGVIKDTISALKLANLWDKLYMLQVYAAHDEQAARVDWIVPSRIATRHNVATFETDLGFKGNGSNMYINTQWSPSNNPGRSGTTWNYHLGAKVYAHTGLNHPVLGEVDTDGVKGLLTAYHSSFSGGVLGGVGHSGGDPIYAHANANPNNHAIVSIAGTNKSNFRAYQDGVLKGGPTANGSGALMSIDAVDKILVLRNSTIYSALGAQFVHAGSNLTDAEVADLHSIMATYLATVAP